MGLSSSKLRANDLGPTRLRFILHFHFPPQQDEEPIDLKNSIEAMIRSRNDFNKSINRVRVEMRQLFNPMNDKNEKTLLNQLLIIPDISTHIDMT